MAESWDAIAAEVATTLDEVGFKAPLRRSGRAASKCFGRPDAFFRAARCSAPKETNCNTGGKRRYKRRNRIEIMFRRLEDGRRVATRYDRCPKAFLSTIVLAATVIFRL